MKKRLRKKKHHGEYKILGVEILIQLKDKEGYDSFHNSFIKEAIEGNGCYFGGGGREDRIEGFIELGYVSDDPESRLKSIDQWLELRRDVSEYKIGQLTDAWHGSFESLS